MPRNISTLLLAIAVFAIVGIGGFVIASAALGGDSVSQGSPGAVVAGEQRVLFSNLGMT
jgi:hypothetical protein